MAMQYASFARSTLDCFFCPPLRESTDYVFHYTKNIKEFREKAKTLEAMALDVNLLVERAKSRGEEIKNQVQDWVGRANKKFTEVQDLEKKIPADHRCSCIFCSPDWFSRYQLSKKASSIAKEIGVICGDKNFDGVSLPPRIPEPSPSQAPAPASHFMSFESTQNAMEDVLKALKEDNNNFNIVGVHGMGGVGKTTMVKQVAEKVIREDLFHRVVMATLSQNVNLKRIHNSIADGLEIQLTKKSDEGRANELRAKIMADKKILIILDDIWERIDLSIVGIPFGNDLEACKSKILLTTRREHVCYSMGCKAKGTKIHLDTLSDEDSWNLFINSAGTVFDTREFESVARQVARECQGLPLALVSVAKALGDKDEEEWEKAARRLKMSVSPNPDHEQKVIECLKLSYDYLRDEGAKLCFLMCCLFPEDHNISKEVLARYGMGLGFFQNAVTLDEARGDADTFTKNLIDSGLLLRSDENGCVKMHDVVRDTAKSITSFRKEQIFFAEAGSGSKEWRRPPQEDVVRDTAKSITSSRKEQIFLAEAGSGSKEWPRPPPEGGFESYTGVSVMFNNIERLPDEPVCPKLKILLLQENSNLMQIPIGFFNRLNNLKVLDISGLQIESLPPSIGLLQNLCTLYMDRCKSKDISIFGGLKKLEILSLRKSRIGSVPEKLAELTELRMLDMTSCLHIETISPQIISRLQGLEELYLHGSFCQWGCRVEGTSTDERNASLEEVINLPRLTVLKVDIEDVNCLPQNVNSTPNWKKFDICISRSYFNRQVNEHLSKLNRVPTRTLFIDATMSTLPDWFFEAVTEKAEMLIYADCDDLKDILTTYNKGRLFRLKSLHVEQCHNVGYLIPLPDGIPNRLVFENLQELHIHHMESMKEICVGELLPGSFEWLKFLKVHQCRSLENSLLQSNMIQRLHNLEMLNITGNSIKEVFQFEGLQEGSHYLKSLKELRLDNLSKLDSIWKGPAQPAYFSKVKTVIVIKCSKLKYLFSNTISQGLLELEELWVEDCSNLDEIIQEDGGITVDKIILPKLKVLALADLERLINFCDENSSLECPLLEHLHIRQCPNFRRPEFHSSKQVQFDNERHYNILKKRLKQPEDGF